MQFIEDICLSITIVSAIFMGKYPNPYVFTWDRINQHKDKFLTKYNIRDAQTLLQLSLMVTSHNYRHMQLQVPRWLKNTDLVYNKCPANSDVYDVQDTSGIDKPGVLGHVLQNKDLLIIVFTGTSSLCQAWIDIDYRQTELDGLVNYQQGVRGHKGVYKAYLAIREQLVAIIKKNSSKQIVITGHSLGGALSQICALDLAYYKPIHYSFAAPLIFNTLASQMFDQFNKYSYRIGNQSDLVTMAPLPIMPNGDLFCHVGKPVLFQNNMGSYPLNHSMAYVKEYGLELVE
jgi:triacylglycerol lipase